MTFKFILPGIFLVLAYVQNTSAQEISLMPVPLQTIYSGQSLDQAEFKMKAFTVPERSRKTYVFEQDQFIGKEAVVTLAAGKPVALRSIRVLEMVKKGISVKATYVAGTIEIQGSLIPLHGGAAGDIVEARNPSSGGVVKARVAADGTLIVELK